MNDEVPGDSSSLEKGGETITAALVPLHSVEEARLSLTEAGAVRRDLRMSADSSGVRIPLSRALGDAVAAQLRR